MADANIKKVIIPKSELPSVDLNNLKYNVRYRIVSEDKNRISYWSRIYSVMAPPVTLLDYTVVAKTSDHLLTIAWNPKADQGLTSFDLYIKWVGTHAESLYPWEYVTTTTINNYLLAYPSTIVDPTTNGTEDPKKVRVAVQRPTYPKEKENYPTLSSVTLFQSSLITI